MKIMTMRCVGVCVAVCMCGCKSHDSIILCSVLISVVVMDDLCIL